MYPSKFIKLFQALYCITFLNIAPTPIITFNPPSPITGIIVGSLQDIDCMDRLDHVWTVCSSQITLAAYVDS